MMITPITSRPDNAAVQALEARATTVQADTTRDPMERELAKATYFSPVMKIDVDTQKAVLQYRDSETGDVERQYPSKERLKAYGGSGPGVGALVAEEAETEADAEEEAASAESGETPKPVELVV
jgi:hypothetical protein